jgi:hypothetical protein
MKKTVFKAVLVAGAIAGSFVLAGAGFGIFHDKLGITTPGILVSDALFPPSSSHQEFDLVGDALRTQIIVDWAFWFALMWFLYWLFRRLGRKLGKSS